MVFLTERARVTRRDAYLGTWGIAFLSLGSLFIMKEHLLMLWALAFIASGVVSIAAAIVRSPSLYVAAFTALSGVAALRACFHLYLIFERGFAENIASSLVWAAVSVAQVVVAGWPLSDEEMGICEEEGQE